MAAISMSSPPSPSAPPRVIVSDADIAQAKQDFMAFFGSDAFVDIAGTALDFAKLLELIYQTARNDPEEAFEESGAMFSDLLQQAESNGHLTGVVEVFFSENFNQVAFVDDLAWQIMANVQKEEEEEGIAPPVSPELIAAAKNELEEFIRSENFVEAARCNRDQFKRKLADARKDAKAVSKLYSDLIRDAEKAWLISGHVGCVFFSPRFDQRAFIHSLAIP